MVGRLTGPKTMHARCAFGQAFIAALFLGVGTMPLCAQTAPSSDQLVGALTCRDNQDCQPQSGGKTRGIGPSPRSFTFEPKSESGRNEIEARVKEGRLPSADVEIYFPYKSSDITPEAKQALGELGRALASQQLAKSVFALIGHTDAKGSEKYNQTLSEARATAVREYLLMNFVIDPARLQAYGRGRSMLKFPKEPFAAANRRVQVVNVGAVAERGK
jgi:outer membrane protein OmpA-like peptidoglycan-associated protein